MFAWPIPADSSFTSNVVPFALLAWAATDAVSFGANGRAAQFAAWNGLETGATVPVVEVRVPVTDRGSQLVGLNVKPGRSRVTLTWRTCSWTPRSIVGNGSLTTVAWAVVGLMRIEPRIVTGLPFSSRLKGPAIAGTSTTSPNGPPLYGPVR